MSTIRCILWGERGDIPNSSVNVVFQSTVRCNMGLVEDRSEAAALKSSNSPGCKVPLKIPHPSPTPSPPPLRLGVFLVMVTVDGGHRTAGFKIRRLGERSGQQMPCL